MEMRAFSRQAPVWLLAAFLLTAVGCGSSLYEYQFEPKTSNPYQLSLNADTNVVAGVLGNNVEMEMKSQQKSLVQYAKEPDGGSSVEYTFIESSIEPSIKSAFPMPEDALAPVVDIYKGMVGQSFTVMLDNRGRAVGIKGIQEMIKGMLGRLELPAEARGMADQIVESSIGEEPMNQLMAQMYPQMPEGELEVGSEWESSLDIQGIVLNLQYILTEREDGKARIEVSGALSPGESHQLSLPGLGSPGLGSLETAYKELEGSYKGFYVLEEATGLAVEFDIDMQLDAVLEVKIDAAEPLSGAPVPPVSMKIRSKTVGSLAETEL